MADEHREKKGQNSEYERQPPHTLQTWLSICECEVGEGSTSSAELNISKLSDGIFRICLEIHTCKLTMRLHQIWCSGLNEAVKNFSYKVISIKIGSCSQVSFLTQIHQGVRNESESSRIERKVGLDQTRHFTTNHADKIFIWAQFQRMLAKVNLGPNLKRLKC